MDKRYAVAALGTVGLLGSSAAIAGGLQRTTQSVAAILTPGNYAEFSYTHVAPDITGVGNLSGAGTGDASENFNLPAGLVKVELTDNLAAGVFEIWSRVVYADLIKRRSGGHWIRLFARYRRRTGRLARVSRAIDSRVAGASVSPRSGRA